VTRKVEHRYTSIDVVWLEMIPIVTHTSSRWVLFCLVVLLAGACTEAPESPLREFCSEVVPMLGDESIGDSIDKLLVQTRAVEEAAQSLEEEPRSQVLATTAPLVEQLLLAQEGQAENGWSSVAVVSEVEELCDVSGLVSWIVQP